MRTGRLIAAIRAPWPRVGCRAAHALLAAATTTTIVVIGTTSLTPLWGTSLLTVAVLAHLALVLSRAQVTASVLVIAGAAQMFTAVAQTPQGTDLWIYQAYGRLIVEYHENPYVVPPMAHPDDPVVERMHGFYVGERAIYGPALVGVATVAAAATGTDERAARLFWQCLAALAVALAAWLAFRRSGQVALVLLLVNPLVTYQIVHLAHIDAVIGLALLGGVLLAERERWVSASLAFAVAALVKAPLAVVLLGVVVHLLAKGERRAAVRAAVPAGVLAAVAALAVGPRAMLDSMQEGARLINRSAWAFPFHGGHRLFLLEVADSSLRDPQRWFTAVIGVVLAGVVCVAAIVAARRNAGVVAVVTAAVVALLVLPLYTSAWSLYWLVALLPLAPAALRSLGVVHGAVFHLSTRWLLLAALAVWGGWAGARSYDAVAAILVLAQIAVAFTLLQRALRRVAGGEAD